MVPEGWMLQPLGSLINFINGKAHENNIVDSGQFALVNSKFISTEGLVKKYTDVALCPAKKNDVLIVMSDVPNGRAIAKCFFVTTDNQYTVNQRIGILRAKICNPKFLYYTVNRSSYFLKFDDGITQTNLRKDEVLECPIRVPPLSEQKKIAQILSTWDKAITTTEQLLANSQQQKKALMQQLLTGKKRLLDNNGIRFSGEWRERLLGGISKITTGSSNRQDSHMNGAYTFFDRSEDIRTSDTYLFDCEAVIVPGEGQDFIPKYFVGKFDLHQRTYAIMDFPECHGKFLFYAIHYFRSHFLSQAVGSTVKSLRLPMFQKMKLNLPTFEEQQKIAAVLSTADQEISALQKKLGALKQEKKALMQQLLTGKRRVKVDDKEIA